MAAAWAAESATLTVTNDLAAARPAETITLPWADLARALPGVLLQHLAVKDAAGRSLPYQVTNLAPEAKDPTGAGVAYGELIFQHDFAAGEKTATFTIEKTAETAPYFPSRVFARYVPERLDDFAWENDKIAHRTYGPALAAPDEPKTGKEVLVTSGLDIWCKRVSYPIVDRWYNKGHDHYHRDEGEGMDMYQVGTSRGCGGTGVWDGQKLYVGRNYKTWKVIANGPIRAIFELTYDAWDAHGMQVAETKRFTVDAGHNLDQIDSTFTVTNGTAQEITVAIGVNKNSGDRGQDVRATQAKNEADGWFTQWEVEKTNGAIGEAVIIPAGLAGFAEDAVNHLVLAKAVSGQPLRYFVGAGWTRGGDFATAADWQAYVAAAAARARSPVRAVLTPMATPARPADVVAVMERVADWQLANPGTWQPLNWENGAFYTGVMALARLSASPRFHDALVALGEKNQWQLAPRPYHADDLAVGQTYAELFLSDRDPRMLAALQARCDASLAHPPDRNLDFDAARNPGRLDRWSWCDALFMAPPAWVRLARATGRADYLAYAVDHWWITSDYLYDPAEHLYFRDSSYFDRREKNGRKVFWSRGNGWVLGGLVRMLQYLPADHPARPRFVAQYREMADRVAGLQSADGFWRSSLLDPESYPMQETSGTGFYCYALAWGVNEGVLDRARFVPVVHRAWAALNACVAADGRLTHVQPVGATPVTFDGNNTAPYGAGAFLLAGSEVHRLSST